MTHRAGQLLTQRRRDAKAAEGMDIAPRLSSRSSLFLICFIRGPGFSRTSPRLWSRSSSFLICFLRGPGFSRTSDDAEVRCLLCVLCVSASLRFQNNPSPRLAPPQSTHTPPHAAQWTIKRRRCRNDPSSSTALNAETQRRKGRRGDGPSPLVTVVIVSYLLPSWSRIFAHL
jgi:hypothetical protein